MGDPCGRGGAGSAVQGGLPLNCVSLVACPCGGQYTRLMEKLVVSTGAVLGQQVLVIDPLSVGSIYRDAGGSHRDTPPLVPSAVRTCLYPVLLQPASNSGGHALDDAHAAPNMPFAHQYERYVAARTQAATRGAVLGKVPVDAETGDVVGHVGFGGDGGGRVARHKGMQQTTASLMGFDVRRTLSNRSYSCVARGLFCLARTTGGVSAVCIAPESGTHDVVQDQMKSNNEGGDEAMRLILSGAPCNDDGGDGRLSYEEAYTALRAWLRTEGSDATSRLVVVGVGSRHWRSAEGGGQNPYGQWTPERFVQQCSALLSLKQPNCCLLMTVAPELGRGRIGPRLSRLDRLVTLAHCASFCASFEPFVTGGGGSDGSGASPIGCDEWDGTLQLVRPIVGSGCQAVFVFRLRHEDKSFVADRLRLGVDEGRDEEAALGEREQKGDSVSSAGGRTTSSAHSSHGGSGAPKKHVRFGGSAAPTDTASPQRGPALDEFSERWIGENEVARIRQQRDDDEAEREGSGDETGGACGHVPIGEGEAADAGPAPLRTLEESLEALRAARVSSDTQSKMIRLRAII